MKSTNIDKTGRQRGSGHGGITEKTAPRKPGRRRVDATLGGSCSSSSDRHQAEAASGVVNDVNNEAVNNINNGIVDNVNNIINISTVQSADLGTNSVRSPYFLRSRAGRSSAKVPCSVCLREFSGSVGLKIHLSKSSCGEVVPPVVVGPCPVQQDSCPQSRFAPLPKVPLRVPVESSLDGSEVDFRNNIRLDSAKLQLEEERVAIKWPAMKEGERWKTFEDQVVDQLPSFVSVNTRLDSLQSAVYEVAKNLFGCVEPVVSRRRRKNRREVRLCQLREEIRDAERAKKNAESCEAYAFDTHVEEGEKES